MKLSNIWVTEIWRLAIIAIVAFLIGITIGHVSLILLIVSSVYIAWQLSHIYKLDKWLSKGLEDEPRHSYGLWDHLFYKIYRQHQKQKKRRAKLKKQLVEFQEAAEALPDAVVVLDKNFVIERFNVTATYLLGLKIPQDIGQRLLNLVRNPLLNEYIDSGNFENRIQINSPINENIILFVRIISYGGGRLMLIARDITYMERIKAVRRDFLANVSHELRTPITVVSGYLETIVDMENINSEKIKQPFEQVLQQTARMESLIDDLLQLARLESSSTFAMNSPVNVRSMLDTLKNDAEILGKNNNHTITIESNSDKLVKGDDKQLFSAFSNLTSNAVRYTPKNGKIIFRWIVDDKQARFEVQDTGIGIAAKHIPRLTERFYRVDIGRSRHSGGTGLGLAIVKHILERHQGHLRIESTPDVGSTFSCVFPKERILSKQQIASLRQYGV